MFLTDKIGWNHALDFITTHVETLLLFSRQDNRVQGSVFAFLFNRLFLSSAHSSSHILESTPISHTKPTRRSTFFTVAIALGPCPLFLRSIQPFKLTFQSHRHTLRPMQLLPPRFLFLSSSGFLSPEWNILFARLCHSFYYLISPRRKANHP